MKITFLGTGTSSGVPVIGCQCKVCHSADPRDNRMRSSLMIETPETRIIIDCGPDFRMQMLRVPFRTIDAVLLTHIHYDHVGGLDDLRPFSYVNVIPVYADASTVRQLHHTMPYIFGERLYPGVPRISLKTLQPYSTLLIGDISVTPFVVYHGRLPIMAYRFGDFAYITDMKSISAEDEAVVRGVKTLVINALRFEDPHPAHILTDDAIAFSRRIGAERVFFTHVTHEIGYHDDADARLPEGFRFAYDGLAINV